MLECSRTDFRRDNIRELETEKYGLSNPTSASPVMSQKLTAMMHMICWRGLCSNHRGLAVLTREYLNPPYSHQDLSPLLASLRDVPGQTVNGIGEDLKTVRGKIWKSFYRLKT